MPFGAYNHDLSSEILHEFFCRVDGTKVAFTIEWGSDNTQSGTLSVPYHLTAGQEVWVDPYPDSGTIRGGFSEHGMQTWFSVTLLHMD